MDVSDFRCGAVLWLINGGGNLFTPLLPAISSPPYVDSAVSVAVVVVGSVEDVAVTVLDVVVSVLDVVVVDVVDESVDVGAPCTTKELNISIATQEVCARNERVEEFAW